ncbi:Fic family protein [Mycoavidus cysteinexigens]|uniref:Fic family protein n=1 Tax=Mycoavidus cysteinexigens TaxID=1553431 RepID=UPI001E554DE0|nr:Fic family protein [Mycoavidus cysteinexigens]
MGVDWRYISVKLRDLFDDAQFWLKCSIYSIDDLVARLHHLLVYIHPFENGNGRCARLMAAALLYEQQKQPFSWGSPHLVGKGDARSRYLDALRVADKGDIQLLRSFVRT